MAAESLGMKRYLSAMKYVDGVVGNSSSGIIEAPSFQVGTINIGDRQKGRIQAASVINCAPDCASITHALQTMFSDEFRETLKIVENPYGGLRTAENILQILLEFPLEGILKKQFYNLPLADLTE